MTALPKCKQVTADRMFVSKQLKRQSLVDIQCTVTYACKHFLCQHVHHLHWKEFVFSTAATGLGSSHLLTARPQALAATGFGSYVSQCCLHVGSLLPLPVRCAHTACLLCILLTEPQEGQPCGLPSQRPSYLLLQDWV